MNAEESARRSARIDAVVDEFVRRRHAGEAVLPEDLVDAHPDISEELAARLGAAEAMLDQPESSVARLPVEFNGPLVAPQTPPSIPGYAITETIHRGGQGVVYRATQESTGREVAVKVMHGGAFASPRDRARFEREVMILTSLKHPNIVTVHDSGTAGGGYYFVMDHIRGKPLDEYVAGIRPRCREVLALFAKIGEAVNVAHLRGVIHRDLKPGNIRVDPSGEPCILDFGLAKVSEFDEMADSRSEMGTLQGQFVGSVYWASPEQALGRPEAIDIRTDVYALGVMLYHALTGRFPYDTAGSLGDVLSRIQRAEPTRPSAVAAVVDHEIEAIILKCLAKEPQRRYQSAGDLARDLNSYLAGEPIEAKRDSSLYLLRKALRRHRVPFAVAAVFVALVTAGFAVSATFWAQAAQARDHADTERQEAQRQTKIAQEVNRFLNVDLLAAADPSNTPDREITVREVLDAASEKIEGEFAYEPLVEAGIRTTLGRTYLGLGKYDAAAPHLERASLLREAELGEDHDETLQAANILASLYHDQGRHDEAEALFDDVIRRRRRVSGEDHPGTLTAMSNLALLYESQGHYDDAEALQSRTLESRRRVHGDDDERTLTTMHNLGTLYMRLGRYDDARPLLDAVVRIRSASLGEEHPTTLTSMNSLASLHYHTGRYAEARPMYTDILRISRHVLGDDHPGTLMAACNLGSLLSGEGKHDEAVPLLTEALEGRRRVLGREHPRALSSMQDLASAYEETGRTKEAETLLTEALTLARRILGTDHADTMRATNNLGVLYKGMRRYGEAEPLYKESLESRRRVLGENHPKTLVAQSNLGSLYIELKQYEEAEALFADIVAKVRASLPEGHWHGGVFLMKHGICLAALERHVDAESALLEAHAILSAARGHDHPYTVAALKELIKLYEQWDKPEKAAAWRAKLPARSKPAS